MNSNGKITPPISIAGDVYKVLGIMPKNGVFDIGYACSNQHGKINIWSKNKPMTYNKFSDLTEDDKYMLFYGLTFTTKNEQPVDAQRAQYNPPEGGNNGYFRITDFNGYNHNAKCPIKDLSDFLPEQLNPKTYHPNTFAISAYNLFEWDDNVEITLDMLPSLTSTNDYIGVMFVNRRTKEGIFFTSGTTVGQAIKGIDLQSVQLTLNELKYNRGDAIDVYTISHETANVIASSNLIACRRLDLTEYNGHTSFITVGFSLNDLRFNGPDQASATLPDSIAYVRINFTRNANGSVTVNQVAVKIDVNYEFSEDGTENYEIRFHSEVNSVSMLDRSMYIGRANAASGQIGFDYAYTNGDVTISASDLRDNNIIIPVSFYVIFEGERLLVVSGELDIENMIWTKKRSNVFE